jgi:hypothetical protein
VFASTELWSWTLDLLLDMSDLDVHVMKEDKFDLEKIPVSDIFAPVELDN